MIADNLKRIMKRKMWTQKRLAEAIGWSEGAVNGWCSGQRIPNANAMMDIAKAMKVSVLDLYGEDYDRKEFTKNHG